MKRIMWLCNTPLQDIRKELGIKICSESWLQGISDHLRKREDIELHYVFPIGRTQKLFKREINGISFWGFFSNVGRGYECSEKRKKQIEKIVQEINPDIIHVFGTEFAHTLECIQIVSDKTKIVVSIQGMISELAGVYTKSIPILEQVLGLGKADNLWAEKYYFYRRGINEKRALKEVNNIIGRTMWDKRCVKKRNPNCRYFYCSETLREPFYNGRWDICNIKRHSIYISQADYPIKGFHIFLKALYEVLKSFPNTHVYVAGRKAFLETDDVYGQYINKLIIKYGLKNKITFLGMLSEERVKEELLQAHITVMPSLLENSPNSIGEAMMLGTPVVAAEVGGIPSLARNQREALLYSGHSASGLAGCIKRMFDSDTLAVSMSENGRKRAEKLYDRKANLEKLLNIYEAVEMN